jgi:hypothetical protein
LYAKCYLLNKELHISYVQRSTQKYMKRLALQTIAYR